VQACRGRTGPGRAEVAARMQVERAGCACGRTAAACGRWKGATARAGRLRCRQAASPAPRALRGELSPCCPLAAVSNMHADLQATTSTRSAPSPATCPSVAAFCPVRPPTHPQRGRDARPDARPGRGRGIRVRRSSRGARPRPRAARKAKRECECSRNGVGVPGLTGGLASCRCGEEHPHEQDHHHPPRLHALHQEVQP